MQPDEPKPLAVTLPARSRWLLRTNVTFAWIFGIEAAINLALFLQPGLGWFILFPPIAFAWIISVPVLLSLPVAWPLSALIAWLNDRDRNAGRSTLRSALFANAWILAGAALFVPLISVQEAYVRPLIGDYGDINYDYVGLPYHLILALIIVPIVWSILLATRARNHRGTILVLTLAAVTVGLATGGLVAKQHIDADQRAKAATATQKVVKKAAIDKRYHDGPTRDDIKFTALTLPGTSNYTRITIDIDDYDAGTGVRLGFALNPTAKYQDLQLTEYASGRPVARDPQTGHCFPDPTLPSSTARERPLCVAAFSTPSGIPVFRQNSNILEYYFIKDGVYVDLIGGNQKTLPTLIDSLVPLPRDQIPQTSSRASLK